MRGAILGPLLRIGACALLFDALVPLAPFLATQTGRTHTAVQIAIAAGVTGFAVAQLSAVPLLRRTGLRTGMIGSSVCLVGLGLLAACLPRSGGTLPLLVAMFLVNAPGSVAARAMLRNALDHASYQCVIGRLYATLEAIEVFLPFAIITAATVIDWRFPFVLICLAVLVSVLPVCLRHEQAGIREETPRQRSRPILFHRNFLAPALLMMLIQGSFTAVALAKPAILLEPLRFTPLEIEVTLSALALLMVGGFHASSRSTRAMSDRARIRLGMLLQCASSVALVLSALAPNALLFVGGCALAALAYCALVPVLHALAMNRHEAARVDASAWLGFLQGAGSGAIVLAGSTAELPAMTRLASTVTICTVLALAATLVLGRNTDAPKCSQAA